MKDIFVWRPVVDNEFGTENLPQVSDTYLVSTIYGENGNLRMIVWLLGLLFLSLMMESLIQQTLSFKEKQNELRYA